MARKLSKEIHVAFDGKEFETEAECDTYEASSPIKRLEGLTLENLHSGLTYKDKEISEALEVAGRIATNNRYAAGDKRDKRGAPKKETATT